ncbi:hypothetical protein SAMN04487968_112116 [Nocardioides terrae]|uniref:Uncharacterized protein n=1 Tax=Nocardioides terrae TaxID=574651 RepID=A0A1I1MJ11_9ACTN|nr:hypothetical protein [Nocardioides terrae]SFC85116.1 hypothetical protein SAMN04487968_112116 [Nocardioides terrae]
MRFTGSFFAALTVASQVGWWAASRGHDEAIVGRARLDPLFGVLFLALLMTTLIWAGLVLFSGGPRAFYESSREWRREPAEPLPPTVPAEPVRTDRVLRVYRPDSTRYAVYAKGMAPLAVTLAAPILAYAIFSLWVDGFLAAGVGLALAIGALLALVMGVYLLCLFRRSRVEIHPNGVTVVGAFRKVVLSNTVNTLVIAGDARTGLHDFGPSYVDRLSGKRCAVWETVFDAPNSVDAMVMGTVPHAVRRTTPRRDLAKYVSIMERERYLPVALGLFGIVLIASLAVGISQSDGLGGFFDDLTAGSASS